MSESKTPYGTESLRVVKSVTLTVSSDWAEVLTALQTAKNKGQRLIIVNVRDFKTAPVAEFTRKDRLDGE